MSLDSISNEDFWKLLQNICREDDLEIDEDFLNNTIKNEMNKNRLFRDYSLIHECYLTLSECYGYLYNNEFEKLSEKQIERRKIVKGIKQKIDKIKTAVFLSNRVV